MWRLEQALTTPSQVHQMSKFTDEGARSRCTIPHLYNQAMWASIAIWRSMPIYFSLTIFFFASQSVMILSSAKDPQPVSSTACMLDRQLSGRMNSPEIFNKSRLQRPWMLMTCTTILNLRWWKKNLSSLLRSVIGQGNLKQKGKTESRALSQPFLNKAPYNSTQTKQQNNCSESKRSHKRDNYGKVKEGMNSSTHTSDSKDFIHQVWAETDPYNSSQSFKSSDKFHVHNTQHSVKSTGPW